MITAIVFEILFEKVLGNSMKEREKLINTFRMLSSFPAKPAVKGNCNDEHSAETLPPHDLIPGKLLYSPCVGTVNKKLVVIFVPELI